MGNGRVPVDLAWVGDGAFSPPRPGGTLATERRGVKLLASLWDPCLSCCYANETSGTHAASCGFWGFGGLLGFKRFGVSCGFLGFLEYQRKKRECSSCASLKTDCPVCLRDDTCKVLKPCRALEGEITGRSNMRPHFPPIPHLGKQGFS